MVLGRGVGTQTSTSKIKGSGAYFDHHGMQQPPMFDHAYYATTPPSSSPEEGDDINRLKPKGA